MHVPGSPPACLFPCKRACMRPLFIAVPAPTRRALLTRARAATPSHPPKPPATHPAGSRARYRTDRESCGRHPTAAPRPAAPRPQQRRRRPRPHARRPFPTTRAPPPSASAPSGSGRGRCALAGRRALASRRAVRRRTRPRARRPVVGASASASAAPGGCSQPWGCRKRAS